LAALVVLVQAGVARVVSQKAPVAHPLLVCAGAVPLALHVLPHAVPLQA
jgi:hypothetical protein